MNQVMRVGNGVLVTIERQLSARDHDRFNQRWREIFPDVPVVIINEAQIVARDGEPILIEFTGEDFTPTFVDEFKRWWEGVTRGGIGEDVPGGQDLGGTARQELRP